MSSGTKITLAVTVLLVGILAVYYGISTGDNKEPAGTTALGTNPREANGRSAAPADGARPAPSRPQQSGDGLLSESVERAAERSPGSLRGSMGSRGSLTPGTADRASTPSPPTLTPMGPHAARSTNPLAGSSARTDAPDSTPSEGMSTPAGSAESDKGTVALPAAAPEPKAEAKPEPAAPTTPATGTPAERAAANQPATINPGPARPTTPAAVAPPRMVDYTVQENDNMWTIALDWFGDGTKWDLISKANPLDDPEQLKVGQKLRLPAKDAVREPAPALPPRIPASGAPAGTTHIVASGDTLAKMARTYYGSVAKWVTIYEANRAVIGADPGALKVGMKLSIPPAKPATKPTGA